MSATPPIVGVPFNRTPEEIIIPTYVAECESPRSDSACETARTANRPIKAAGWYVEFRYPCVCQDLGATGLNQRHTRCQAHSQYRTFIPFPGEVAQ